jgi:nucleotide-binding universal stress UspA family protein
MRAIAEPSSVSPHPLPAYGSILLAADASDHANRGALEAAALAVLWQARVTGIHVYAAKMHDLRFRQMEGGLPEQFREERELERQRDVHDNLITRGLSVIADSYLDQVARVCQEHAVRFSPSAPEGKNYRALVAAANGGNYDLLVLGALGLGAIEGSRLGSVTQRVARRSAIDTLVIRDPQRAIAEGPIVVAVDGSRHAYGGLLTALSLASRWRVPLKVVAAFDPYYHYVAFNRIAGVLSEQAGKVFRFQEQEKLHEEIIDSGLAKIYEGHLKVARSVAAEYGAEVETELLDGKPHDAIERYLNKVKPSLLVIGKLGIHADPELDIGGNAENLLRNAPCSVLLSQRQYQPSVDRLAEVTTSWTREAEERIERVPALARDMARMAILRYAQERGHTVITARLADEATMRLCPHAARAMQDIVAAHDAGRFDRASEHEASPAWSVDAAELIASVSDESVRNNLRLRAEKKARQHGERLVDAGHVRAFMGEAPLAAVAPNLALSWQSAALARLAAAGDEPERQARRGQIEEVARARGESEVTLEIAEAVLGREEIEAKRSAERCPFGGSRSQVPAQPAEPITWSAAAAARMDRVPDGFMRDLTRQRLEAFARRRGAREITSELIDEKYAEWGSGSEKQTLQLAWTPECLQRIERIPEFVRGMVVKEVERCAREMRADTVTAEVLERASGAWASHGGFHSESNAGQYSSGAE